MKAAHAGLLTALVAAPLASLTPAYADDAVVTGATCGMSTTAPAEPNPRFTGSMWGGPVTVTTSAGPAEELTVTCSVQFGSLDHFAPDAVRASSPRSSGTAVLPPLPIAYTAPDGKVVAMCTEYAWTEAGGQQVYRFDADNDPSNGAQCDPVVDVQVGPSRLQVCLSRRPEGDICVYWIPPWGTQREKLACVPPLPTTSAGAAPKLP